MQQLDGNFQVVIDCQCRSETVLRAVNVGLQSVGSCVDLWWDIAYIVTYKRANKRKTVVVFMDQMPVNLNG